jgi:DNA-binding MarR family transcriptional regulator
MVVLIDALEHSGLVERRRDPADRQGYEVNITTKGVKLLHTATDAIRVVARDLLAPVSAQEQRQFRTLLGKLVLDGDSPRA